MASLPEDLNLRQRRFDSLKFHFKLGLDFAKSTFINFTLMLPDKYNFVQLACLGKTRISLFLREDGD
jgi:hypothetical protein